jgi:hypothetical protein
MKKLFRRRRRSGNGVSSAQDLYIMVNLPFLWVWKIGISRNAADRARQVSKNVPGWMVTVAAVRLRHAYAIEQFLLRVTAWAQVDIFGRKDREYRHILAGLPVLVVVLLLLVLKYVFYVALLVGLLYWLGS